MGQIGQAVQKLWPKSSFLGPKKVFLEPFRNRTNYPVPGYPDFCNYPVLVTRFLTSLASTKLQYRNQTWAILLKVTLTLTFWGYWHWQLTLNWWLLNNWHWHWCWSIIMTQHWHWHWGQKNIDIDIDIEGLFEKNNWHWHWTLSVLHRSVRKGFYWCWISMLCKELFVSSHFFETPDSHIKMALFFKGKVPPSLQ